VRAIAVQADVAEPASVDGLAARGYDEFGAVHVLCNNAGVFIGGALADTPPEEWAWLIAVNLMGVVNGVRAFLPRLRLQGGQAHIVNTGSVSGLYPTPNQGAYTATKYAVVGYTERLREERGEAVERLELPAHPEQPPHRAKYQTGAWHDRGTARGRLDPGLEVGHALLLPLGFAVDGILKSLDHLLERLGIEGELTLVRGCRLLERRAQPRQQLFSPAYQQPLGELLLIVAQAAPSSTALRTCLSQRAASLG